MDHSSFKSSYHIGIWFVDEFVAAPRIYRELWTATGFASATCEMDFSRKYYGELWSSRETIES
jgi:hypothetical protein